MFIVIIVCIGLAVSASSAQSQTSPGCWSAVGAPALLCELDSGGSPCPL